MTQGNRPRESRGTLDPLPGCLIIENGMLFDYYPIKLGERKGDFITFQKLSAPPSEGYVMYNRRLYKLTIRDYFRGQLNVAQQPVPIAKPDATPAASSDTAIPGPAITVVTTGADRDQSGSSDMFGIQERQAADMAWAEQVESLLHADDPQEEWIVPALAQP